MFPAVLIQVVFVLLIVGVLLWGLNQIPAIDGAIKQLIRVAVIVITAIWLLYVLFGAFGGYPVHWR